jgi:cell pole-organizing protein PopZ
MTRLDASSDPSMEDILASIRKIIAEDPPGSRPSPPPPRAPEPPASNLAFGRPFMPKAAPVTPAPAAAPRSEPVLSFGESVPATAEFKSPSRGLQSFEALVPASPPWQDERSGDSQDLEPEFQTEAEPEMEAAVALAPHRSVDDQLSDLLDDVPRAAETFADIPREPATQQQPVEALAKSVVAEVPTAVAHAGPAVTHPELETRPRFTVSRDGYVPTPARDAVKSDPFDFDLGPSPFEIKAKPAASAATAAVHQENIASLVSRALESAAPAKAPHASNEATAAAKAAVEPKYVSASNEQPAFLSPSVNATLNPEPIMTAAPAAAPRFEAAPSPVVAPAPSNAASTKPGPAVETAIAILEPASSVPSTHVRSMEDTVADLLRPLLKSWLAENMPKIVERALRREMTEQTHGEHKAAAE